MPPTPWGRQVSSGLEIGLGLGLLGGLIFLGIWLLRSLISWLVLLDQTLSSGVLLTLVLGAGCLTLLVLFHHRIVTEQRRRDLRDRRAGVYREVVKFYLEIMQWEKLGKEPKTEEEISRFHARVTPQLLMWASDGVVKRYAQLRSRTPDDDSNSVDLIFEFEKLFLAMRNDLGHSNRGLSKGDVLSLFVNDITQYVSPADAERVE